MIAQTKSYATIRAKGKADAVESIGRVSTDAASTQPMWRKNNMTLTEYFKDEPRGAKAEMAEYLKITPTWLSQLMKGERRASAALCMKIEKATGGLVKRKELRPDLFGSAKS